MLWHHTELVIDIPRCAGKTLQGIQLLRWRNRNASGRCRHRRRLQAGRQRCVALVAHFAIFLDSPRIDFSRSSLASRSGDNFVHNFRLDFSYKLPSKVLPGAATILPFLFYYFFVIFFWYLLLHFILVQSWFFGFRFCCCCC